MTTAPPELESRDDDKGPLATAEGRFERAEARYSEACAACPRPPRPEDVARLDALRDEMRRLGDELQALYSKDG